MEGTDGTTESHARPNEYPKRGVMAADFVGHVPGSSISLWRRVLFMWLADGRELGWIQRLGAAFMALVPLPGVVAVAVSKAPTLAFHAGDAIMIAIGVLILTATSAFAGANALGGFFSSIAGDAVLALEKQDAETSRDWHADAEANAYFRAKVRVGYWIFGWVALAAILTGPFVLLGQS